MEDLLGEDWQKPAKPLATTTPSVGAFASNYSSFRPSPQLQGSGTASPQNISRPSSTVNGAKQATGDSFGNLLNLKSPKIGNSLSMQERQKQLLEEKRRQQEQQAQLWDSLGSGRGTPEIRQPSPAVPASHDDDEEDILAAFNKDAPVNKASYFSPPPPSGPVSGRSTPAIAPTSVPTGIDNTTFDDDDDPFGLNSMPKRPNGHGNGPSPVVMGDDDDILGDLGKPVSMAPPKRPERTPVVDEHSDSDDSSEAPTRHEPQDRQLAELVDMGFAPDTAKIALAETGGNVQNAVGWLLQQAHEESKQKAKGNGQQRERRSANDPSPQRRQRADREGMPSWMGEEARSNSTGRQKSNASPANGERDPAQVAQEYGSKLLKSAGSLWKASQKQMAKTLSDFQQEGGSSQPKWMQDPTINADPSTSRRREQGRPEPRQRDAGLTDEAAMLDAPRTKPQRSTRPQQQQQPTTEMPSRIRSPVEPLSQRPQQSQRLPPQQDRRPVAKLTRQDVEEQSAQAYISPARRKKNAPVADQQSSSNALHEPQEQLMQLDDQNNNRQRKARQEQPIPQSRSAPPPSQVPSRPPVPPRSIPSISPAALSTSASHRKAGGEHYKRGDYAAAHESYTAALKPLPATHPVIIIVLTNRALTAIKTGDAKTAVSDADRALEVIGPSLGAGETIDLGAGEGVKDMKEFYGKAVMRKAEALEHLEKYPDAAAAWRLAISAGVGGAVSLRGRDRCEKASGAPPKPSSLSTPAPRPVKRTTPKPPSTKPATAPGTSAEAVTRLRQANAAADKADDEKFALTDQVDARLAAWRGGKTDNLRALLQSMDAVLWESAGWKKVGMADLVIPGKVKIVYMKAIAKVHPDKIPQDATTEQRMISASVFSTLNEAWDKFKKDNNL